MKVLKKSVLNVLLALVMVFSFVFPGWGNLMGTFNVNADTASLEQEFTNNGQFTVAQYGANTQEYVENVNGSEGAVLKVNTLGAGTAYILFNAPQVKASMVESIVVRVYSPGYDAADSFRASSADLSAGWKMLESIDMSSWYGVTLSESVIALMTDENGYLSNQVAFGARVHGSASEYYIDSITITLHRDWDAEFTNDGQFVVSNYAGDTVNYPYSIVDGAKESLPVGYDGAVAKIGSKVNGGAAYFNVDFTASKINAAEVESVVARCYLPNFETADLLRINNIASSVAAYDLSTWCDVELPLNSITGTDGNLGSFAFGMRDKGSTISDYFYIDSIIVNMIAPAEPILVNFTNINVTWNNYFYENSNCTFLHFDGGISGNGGLDADFSDLLAKMTINGEAVDTANVSFMCPNWVGASGGIMFRFVTAPAKGAQIVLPAGASFDIGGTDTNVYTIASDVVLNFNGSTWAVPVSKAYTIIKVTDPYEAETLTTYQNADGTFTYTLPEYTREGKVLLGYVMNSGSGENLAQTFIPSGEYTTSETEVVFIALWGEFTTIDGASIRIASAETSGIRWTTTIDAEGFGNIAYWAKGGYEFGTELSAEGFGENFDIKANTWKVENNTYTGVLIDINSQYYTTTFTARGYVKITYSNGETKKVYATANDTTRSIKQVAQLAIASGDYSGTQLTILKQIAGV